MTVWFLVYRGIGYLAEPPLRLHVKRRLHRGKEQAHRIEERFGHYSEPRPDGVLFWFHAVSVGESLSILPVIDRLLAARADLQVLVTTGTRSSADLMVERLPGRARHAYIPFDTPPAVARFMVHWRPDATVFTEQELWPNLLAAAPRPRFLVNARFSERTAKRWQRLSGVIRWLLQRFDVVLAQSEADAVRLRAAGAPQAVDAGNLKEAAPPLPVEPSTLSQLQAAIGGRPVWLAASTHAPEERLIAEAARDLRNTVPNLLTVIVPRHPPRGDSLRQELPGVVAQRSRDEPLGQDVEIYLADTLGELGLFYRVANLAFIGGSLIPHGGQNPLEAARLGVALIFGPHMHNFAEPTDRLLKAGAALQVPESEALAPTVRALLGDPHRRQEMARAALASGQDSSAVELTANTILKALPR